MKLTLCLALLAVIPALYVAATVATYVAHVATQVGQALGS